ncbi:MAG: hypothetical protein J0H79_13935 [Alphaproteobacteria bacterium]|nr:hypothetical protein [Alphaproteobacteria bacterium]
MRSLDSATRAALQSGRLVGRNFFRVGGKNRSTGVPEYLNLWNDVGVVDAPVTDVETGTTVVYTFTGSGTLVSVDNVPLTMGVDVRMLKVALSNISATVINLVRGYDVKNGTAQIWRGLFDPESRNLVAAATSRFVGFVDKCVINDPPIPLDGKGMPTGSVTLTIASHTRELTRASTEKRSNESQKRRAANDLFYKDAGVVGSWQVFWGQERAAPSQTVVVPPRNFYY